MTNCKPLAVLLMLAASGCHVSFVGKRCQEKHCPTDVRQSQRWIWGEDALFECPCQPDEAYHGHRPTCWRPWQAPATVWRDEQCCTPPAHATPLVVSKIPAEAARALAEARAAGQPEPIPGEQPRPDTRPPGVEPPGVEGSGGEGMGVEGSGGEGPENAPAADTGPLGPPPADGAAPLRAPLAEPPASTGPPPADRRPNSLPPQVAPEDAGVFDFGKSDTARSSAPTRWAARRLPRVNPAITLQGKGDDPGAALSSWQPSKNSRAAYRLPPVSQSADGQGRGRIGTGFDLSR